MCVNQQLQSRLLAAAAGRVTLNLSYLFLMAGRTHRSLVLWVLHHLRLGTLRHVALLTEQLGVPRQDYISLVLDACGLGSSHIFPFVNRLASALGSAATNPGAVLPRVERWYCGGEFLNHSWLRVPFLRPQSTAGN
jgi:hypothetical protein